MQEKTIQKSPSLEALSREETRSEANLKSANVSHTRLLSE